MLNFLRNSPKLVAFGNWFGSTAIAMKENANIYREMAEVRAPPDVHAALADDQTLAEMGWRIVSSGTDQLLQFAVDHPIVMMLNLWSIYFTYVHIRHGWHYLSQRIQKPEDSQTDLAEAHTAEDTKKDIPLEQPLLASDMLEATSI